MITSDHTIRKSGERRSIEPDQYSYDIVLDCGIDTVKHVCVRFGILDDKWSSDKDKIYTWLKIIDTVDTEYKAGKTVVVASVNDSQLPASADTCYYQLLCEIEGKLDKPDKHDKHGELHEREMFMTKPVLLGKKKLGNIPSTSTPQEESVEAMSELAGYQS